MKKIVFCVAFVGLSGCLQDVPVVSGYNGDSVNIQSTAVIRTPPTDEENQKAATVCAQGGKKAQYASTRMVAEYTQEHLFLCL